MKNLKLYEKYGNELNELESGNSGPNNFMLIIPVDDKVDFYVIRTTYDQACKKAMILVNYPMPERDLPKSDFNEWLGVASVLKVGNSSLIKSDNVAYKIIQKHTIEMSEIERLLNTADKNELISALLNSFNII